jgi:Protein of unknown function (DUF2637)
VSAQQRRATRFFWTVLLSATTVSIAGNAVHAVLNTTAVPTALAAAVATVPPLVLVGSTEGVALLVRARRGSSVAYWCALAMTALLAACAFVLSFDALQDLATRAGIDRQLAWLWPIAIDASIAQCTVALLSLSRGGHNRPAVAQGSSWYRGGIDDDGTQELVTATGADRHDDPAALPASALVPEASALVDEGVTKQSPEVVTEVLRRHRSGQRAGSIATEMKLHHSTVNRLLNASHRRGSEASIH